MKTHFPTAFITLFLISLSIPIGCNTLDPTKNKLRFSREMAYHNIIAQMDFGPRTPNSIAHQQTVEWIQESLRQATWSTTLQEGEIKGQLVTNIIGKRGEGDPLIILAAHYDTRLVADNDPIPENRSKPVPGANDGASGVAVLIELARVIPNNIQGEIWLVFFDAEDNGRVPGWDWILGSQLFVDRSERQPLAVVVVDMIGDADLQVFMEKNSDKTLTREIWDIAASLGYADYFIPQTKYAILDDHIPFLQAGIPAVVLIDFDYPYWHTTADTADKVSSQSLQVVGDTLLYWLLSKQIFEP